MAPRLLLLPSLLALAGAAGDELALVQQMPTVTTRALISAWGDANSRRPKRRHRPVVFVHLHKAGGTSMCQLARANREVLMWSADPTSCNWLPYDDYKFWAAPLRPDCGDRLASWLASGFTWTQLERPFLAQDHYATMLRHPVDTALSMANFNDPSSEYVGDRYRFFMDCLEARQDGNSTACGDEGFLPSLSLAWLYFDNPIVRMLGGLDAWALPPGQVRREHADQALAVLAKFDLVLFLEDLDSQRTRERLAGLLGWSDFRGAHANPTLQRRVAFTEEDVRRLERLNAQDLYLYRALRARERALQGEARRVVDVYANHTGL